MYRLILRNGAVPAIAWRLEFRLLLFNPQRERSVPGSSRVVAAGENELMAPCWRGGFHFELERYCPFRAGNRIRRLRLHFYRRCIRRCYRNRAGESAKAIDVDRDANARSAFRCDLYRVEAQCKVGLHRNVISRQSEIERAILSGGDDLPVSLQGECIDRRA